MGEEESGERKICVTKKKAPQDFPYLQNIQEKCKLVCRLASSITLIVSREYCRYL